MSVDYSEVTELADDEVSLEQIERLANRYYWCKEYCRDKDVLELACGHGQGLGYLTTISKSVVAGDIMPSLVDKANAHYGDRVDIRVIDAQDLPFPDNSFDVIILFEAIYYLPDVDKFMNECKRVLRGGGMILLATANKDLYDFNPSPYSHKYYGAKEINDLFVSHGFSCDVFASWPVDAVSIKQKILRPIKKIVVTLNLMPKTMAGKKLLKRLVFGRLQKMPAEITSNTAEYVPPVPVSRDRPDTRHKVLLAAGKLS